MTMLVLSNFIKSVPNQGGRGIDLVGLPLGFRALPRKLPELGLLALHAGAHMGGDLKPVAAAFPRTSRF